MAKALKKSAKKTAKKTAASGKKGFAAKKGNIGSLWRQARDLANERAVGDVPDGTYVAKLTGAKIDTIGQKNWKHVDLEFTIVQEGEGQGEVLHSRGGIDNAESLSYTMSDLARLGVDIDSLEIASEEELAALLEELVGAELYARIRVQNKDGFANVRINKVIDYEEEEGEEEDEEEEAEGEEEEAEEEEAEAEEEEAEEGNLEVGSSVEVKHKGKDVIGKVQKIYEDQGKVLVKLPRVPKAVRFALDDVTVLLEE